MMTCKFETCKFSNLQAVQCTYAYTIICFGIAKFCSLGKPTIKSCCLSYDWKESFFLQCPLNYRMLICKNSLYCRCVMHPSGSLDYRNKINSMTSLLELSVSEIIILLIIQRCSILKQTIWHSNHTSHTKLYFNEFVANVFA